MFLFLYDKKNVFMTFKSCGILENLVNFVRYAWGCWFDMDISIYTRKIFLNLVSV